MAQGSYKDDLKKDAMSFLNNFDTMGDPVTMPSAHHDHSAHTGGEHSHGAGGHDRTFDFTYSLDLVIYKSTLQN